MEPNKSTVNIESHPSDYENSWRLKFPKSYIIILSIIQTIFTLIIFALEIGSLTILPTDRPTGVGIWCSVPFMITIILTFILALKKKGSRVWASRVLIAQLILLFFTFILIGITGDYVATINSHNYIIYATDDFISKYRIVQTELAFGILLMFSSLIYVGLYIFITYIALWKPFHTIDTNHLFHE